MQTIKSVEKRFRLPVLVGTVIIGVSAWALSSAVGANAQNAPGVEFKSYSEITATIPDYYFSGNSDINLDRSSELPIAETRSATYWYIKNSQGDHCLVAQTKSVDQVSAGCVPEEFLKDRPLSLQMFQQESNAFNVAAFLLPEGFTSDQADSNAEFVTANFIEIDEVATPGAYDQDYMVVGKDGMMRLEIYDVEAPR